MRANSFNLARRPFANQAPVLRIGVLLAILALVLTFLNAQRYRSYFAGQGKEARVQISEIDGQIEALNQELASLQRDLGGFDVDALNDLVTFLNLRVRERTFEWSRLFQDLETVVPATVRLTRLSPTQIEGDGGREMVLFTISGEARSEEGLLDFVDALFAHQRFQDPNPSRRSVRDNLHDFNLTVLYTPPRRGGAPGRARAVEGAGS